MVPSSAMKSCEVVRSIHETKSDEMSCILPPLTTASVFSERQGLISSQPWEQVSSRIPIGCHKATASTETLIDYAATILEMRLADVVRNRWDAKNVRSQASSMNSVDPQLAKQIYCTCPSICPHCDSTRPRSNSLDEGQLNHGVQNPDDMEPVIILSSSCRMQIRAYVRRIASMYHKNRYHALEHAVHVTMSANKLLEMLQDGSDHYIEDNTALKSTSLMDLNINNRNSKQSRINLDLFESCQKAFSHTLTASSSKGISQLKRMKRSRSFSIYSDNFLKFAFVFAAFIHDVDHQGVPNARLVLEDDPVAKEFGGVSVAEKHSIKVAFQTLNEKDFDEFQAVLFESPDDRLRMHYTVTNLVISTDIASPERMQWTKMRWEEAFSHPLSPASLPIFQLSLTRWPPSAIEVATVTASEPRLVSMLNSKLPIISERTPSPVLSFRQEQRSSLKRVLKLNSGQTVEYFTSFSKEEIRMALRQSVVIEAMINVADVAHSMQSWELFLFWNRNLFEELYHAFKSGRSENNPSNGWYENQLYFYKIYVLPLAEKMDQCGLFKEGKLFFNNAVSIRDQWEIEGEKITKDMISAVQSKY